MTAAGPKGPDLILRDILRGLADGRFAPGQRLSEPDLMRRYGVGRSTVREALGRLAAGGVVDLVAHRGARIRLLGRSEAANVLRVTGALLALAARQAAEAVAAGADAGGLALAANGFVTGGGTDPRARARYYRALAALAGNRELERLLPSMQVHLIRAQFGQAHPQGMRDHRALTQAVCTGAPDRAEAAAIRHIRRLIDTLPHLPDEAFATDDGDGRP